MADWDDDSPQLRTNLTAVLRAIRASAAQRETPTLESARQWQRDTMKGLEVPRPEYVGRFRGEAGIETVRVWIAAAEGVAPGQVQQEMEEFEGRLQRAVAALDARYPSGKELDTDGLAAVIDLAAWARAEWVRIHPFANGNGRTARMWANAIFMRYGLDPVVRLRPRPDGGYGRAAARAMQGDWRPTAAFFERALTQLPAGPRERLP
jgi:hypothetical protein